MADDGNEPLPSQQGYWDPYKNVKKNDTEKAYQKNVDVNSISHTKFLDSMGDIHQMLSGKGKHVCPLSIW